MSIRVLLVEDDADFRVGLEGFLSGVGHSVRSVADAEHLEHELEAHPPHILVLDLNLPGPDGFSVAHALRERTSIGVVVLTGRTAREDRVRGLELGVDHYFTKPFDPAELDLVIRNLHRRLTQAAMPAPVDSARLGKWALDGAQWVLVSPEGTRVRLSSTEYQLVSRLAARQGRPVARADLIQRNDARDPLVAERGLDVLVFRLRKRVEAECGCKLPVMSVRGLGYVFDAPIEILPA
ncbi:response regulator transcription factor [Aquabacter spiritensis]|uniref:DNA-binding response OmpR family regulator n=1 Tax=Aquabacter spiritensis TaxID=933073 RepID=A0A4V2UX56_9HYPH|nr:response regulator transcription factor [Aquabacter spiritensis]TCT02188.1 DNA-binding response OmpR family regulator [Aquabacter spiritensis]